MAYAINYDINYILGNNTFCLSLICISEMFFNSIFIMDTNKHKLSKYNAKYKIAPKIIYLKKIIRYGGGGKSVDDEQRAPWDVIIACKHIKLFGKRIEDEYDKFFSENVTDEMFNYLPTYIFNIEKTILKKPSIIILNKIKLYHSSRFILKYPTAKCNFFSIKPEDNNNYIIPYLKNRHLDTQLFYTYTYEIFTPIVLIKTSSEYTVINLETYFQNLDTSYIRHMCTQPECDNNNINIASWMEKNIELIRNDVKKNISGWYEQKDALREGIMTEIMIIGNTQNFLKFVDVTTIPREQK